MSFRRFKLFLISILFLSISQVNAQGYEPDLLRFSSNNFSGTARYVAVGGAFSSVGADMSNFSYNPGGIGMYRSTVFQLSLGTNYSKYNTNYLATSNKDVKVRASLPSMALVFAIKKPSKNGLFRSSAFGVAFNRLADFNYSEKVSAFNTTPGSSLSWSWVNEMSSVYNGAYVNETSLEEVSFNTYTGFYGYLVNFDSAVLDYSSPVVDSFLQTRYVDSKGGKNEIVLSGGANYLDKLFFGVSVGLPILSQTRETRFIESDSLVNTSFKKFELVETDKSEGFGFNVKLGAIYKVNDWFRVGGGFQTPERISMNQKYSSVLDTKFDTVTYNVETGEGELDYTMRLPWRANMGASFFFKNKGFLSVDYEAVGFNAMRYNFGSDFKEVSDQINTGIKAKYKVAHHVRVGIEGVIKKFRIRGGYAFSGSPIRKQFVVEDYDFSRHTISGGIGLMFNRFAIDFAYQHNLSRQFEQPYQVSGVNISGVNKAINQGTGIITFSYKLK